jgi:putative transposase
MSRKYKFYEKEGVYFVSFATVYWIDVFTRTDYMNIIVDSLSFCIRNKGMELFCWCLMPSHLHLIFRAQFENPSDLLRDFKKYTSKQLVNCIEENVQESRREWLLWMFKRAGEKNSNVKEYQFWQQHNKPIWLYSPEVTDQKLDYIHNNPVVSGFVLEPKDWKYSSAIDYSGGQGLLKLNLI